MTTLKFLGATGTVTGSKFLVDTGTTRLLVDDGMFQGPKKLRSKNWEPFPEPPRSIDHVLLTHAHLDHTGMLPRLIAHGYENPVHATPGSVELLHILWPDAGKLQEEDARYANRKGFSKHKPALPLYTVKDAKRALNKLVRHRYNKEILIAPGVTAKWIPTGHIVGAAMILLTIERADGPLRILFSGDVGPYQMPVMNDPTPPPQADVLLVESTYGDRDHARTDPKQGLLELLKPALARGGRALIPSFAVGRTQLIMYLVTQLIDEGLLPDVPVVVDSPMAVKATSVLEAHREEHDDELRDWIKRFGNPFNQAKARLIATAQESKRFCVGKRPAVIISASGMCTGGRVLHYLRQLLPDEKNVVVFSGYQAVGTRGRRILEGEPEVKIHGRMVPVNAQIGKIPGLSAHADRTQLIKWLSDMPNAPQQVFLVHGEEHARQAFQHKLKEDLGWSVECPELYQEFEL